METVIADNRLALIMAELIRRDMDSLKKEFNVSSLAMFGSYIRGEQTPESDIDMLFEFSAPVGFFKFIDLEERLSNILGRKVDLVSRKGIKSRIYDNIKDSLLYI